MTDPNAPLVSVRNLAIRLGTHDVLRNVDLDIAPGERILKEGYWFLDFEVQAFGA